MKRWLLLALLAACGNKSDDPHARQCAEIYGRLSKAAAALGAEMDAEAEKTFLKMCKSTPLDMLPCLENPASSPKCKAAELPADHW